MSEAEERQKRAQILLDYVESKRALALLRRDARAMAQQFDDLSKVLKERPDTIDNPDLSLPIPKEVLDLSKRIKQASEDFGQKELDALNQGFERLP